MNLTHPLYTIQTTNAIVMMEFVICILKSKKINNIADNILSRITTFLNRIVDVVSQGNLHRITILSQFTSFSPFYLSHHHLFFLVIQLI